MEPPIASPLPKEHEAAKRTQGGRTNPTGRFRPNEPSNVIWITKAFNARHGRRYRCQLPPRVGGPAEPFPRRAKQRRSPDYPAATLAPVVTTRTRLANPGRPNEPEHPTTSPECSLGWAHIPVQAEICTVYIRFTVQSVNGYITPGCSTNAAKRCLGRRSKTAQTAPLSRRPPDRVYWCHFRAASLALKVRICTASQR